MKFLIKWRNRNYGLGRTIRATITGLSRFASREAAQEQVSKWQSHFPFNTYYIESI